MKSTDRQRFAAIVTGFAELKGKQLSVAALDLFWKSMQDWDIDEFTDAAAYLIKTCTFMPTPKDFDDLRKSARPSSGEAWAIAVRHAASSAYRKGPTGLVDIDRAVNAIGGYKVIAMHDEEKLHFLERRFSEHFDDIQDKQDTRMALPNLTNCVAYPEIGFANPFANVDAPKDKPKAGLRLIRDVFREEKQPHDAD